MELPLPEAAQGLILFDGVCNLCNTSVQFILLRDKKGYFAFAPLQSAVGQAVMAHHKLPTEALESVLLLENGRLYTHSTAALRIARRLTGLWPILYVGVIIPKILRDGLYHWIARNRYRWFGKQEACIMPRPEWKNRFLNA
jgi:predicted DCC family thiol-disulfide oxidoreductase YuxK